jgi:hypothetical protein
MYVMSSCTSRRNLIGSDCGFKGLSVILLVSTCILISITPTELLSADKKTFIIRNMSHDLESFRPIAELGASLKPYGRVQIEISALADKSWYEIPPGGSPWHEYACHIAAPWKFFPHPDIAPHLPADWVAANRKLMLEKAAVVRELGLGAMAYAKNSHFLPESFFRQFPELRGPRVDHPRRSRREEFVWCTDLPRTREIIEWMMMELLSKVPEIETVFTGTNDSGSGLCWAAAQYPGPNGPRHCKDIPVSQRVRTLCETVHGSAGKLGRQIVQRWGHTNLWDGEMEIVLQNLPPGTYINSRDPSLIITGTMINDAYPFRGMIDPLQIIGAMEKFHQPEVETVLLMLTQEFYGRGDDSPEAVAKFLELFIECIERPVQGLKAQMDMLSMISERWGGAEHGDKVFDAFYNMHQALELTDIIVPNYRRLIRFCPVSLRYMTRPLLIRPDVLSSSEEAYFLPHIFNIRTNEARMDYIDIHGSRMRGTATWDDRSLHGALKSVIEAARTLENCTGAPEEKWLKQVALGLRMWVSEMRSIHNFYHAQLIRDENAEILAGPPRIPLKTASWSGEGDILPWNEIMRDEFDNTGEFIALLKCGGLELVARAVDSKHEDTFLLGPDLLEQLEKKRSLMRAHWLDVQDYLAPPLK